MAKLSEIIKPTDFDSIMVETPSNGEYLLTMKVPMDVNYSSIKAITSSGTCDVVLQVDSTNVTGASVTAATTQASASFTEAVSAGSKIGIIVSSNSSAADLEVILMRA